jgi:hypothetical protein
MAPNPASGGGPTLFLPLVIICVIGIGIIIGAVYARRKGRLQAPGFRYAIVAIIVLLGVAAWFGPYVLNR